MFLSHLHNFRAIAIIGIVGAHTLHAFLWNEHPLMFRFFDTLFNQSSILFFFIAGFLFQYLSKRFEKWLYWKKKFQYVIIPYLILSIPGLYYYTQMGVQDTAWDGFYDYSIARQIMHFLLTGKHLAPFWFVPTISLFYLMAPLLLKADKDRRIYWFLPALMLLSFFMGRDGHYLFFIENLNHYGQFDKAIYLFSIYLFGMFCSVHHDKVIETIQKYHLIMLIMTIALILGNVFTIDNDINYIYASKLIMCPLLIYYFYKTRNIFDKKLFYLAHISFGIFFIHAYILPAIKILYLKTTGNVDFPEGSLLNYISLTIMVTLMSVIIIYLCQKVVGKYSRMLLGA